MVMADWQNGDCGGLKIHARRGGRVRLPYLPPCHRSLTRDMRICNEYHIQDESVPLIGMVGFNSHDGSKNKSINSMKNNVVIMTEPLYLVIVHPMYSEDKILVQTNVLEFAQEIFEKCKTKAFEDVPKKAYFAIVEVKESFDTRRD